MSAARITPGWYSIAGASAYTGFSLATITKALSLGLPASRLTLTPDSGKEMIRIKRDTLDLWIEGGEIPKQEAVA